MTMAYEGREGLTRIVHAPGEIMTDATVGLKGCKDGTWYGCWVRIPEKEWSDPSFNIKKVEQYLYENLAECSEGVTPPEMLYPFS